jgi:hypothetical protein
MLAHAQAAMVVQFAFRTRRIDHEVSESVGEGDEVALGIDDACCTQGALCSSRRRSRWDLPEPELPCTSRRVAR